MFHQLRKWIKTYNILTLFEIVAAILTVLSIIISGVIYLSEIPNRKRNTIFEAWQVVTNTEGKKGSGGREKAIILLKENNEDLSGIKLDDAILKNIDLSNVSFSNVSAKNSNLSESNFSNSTIKDTCFNQTRLHKSFFVNALLHSINLKQAIITDSNLTLVVIKEAFGDSATTFNGSKLIRINISSSNFIGSTFNNCDIEMSNFYNVDISNSSFIRTALTHSIWIGVTGKKIDLSLSHSDEIVIQDTDLSGAKMDGGFFKSSYFSKVVLSDASFFDAKLQNSQFIDSNLSNVNFSSADLQNVMIENCNIDGAIFTKAKNKDTLSITSSVGNPINIVN